MELHGATRPALATLADRTLLVGFEEPRPPDWIRRIAAGLGGVVLYGRNLHGEADAATLANQLRTEGEVLIAVDEEGGDVTRLHFRTGSPTPGNLVLGAVDDLGATAAIAAAIGAQLRCAGILLNLAPDADVNLTRDNPVIGVRAFGSDPRLVARHVGAWVRGLQSQGVAGCAKHFPGHGSTVVDSHLGLPTVSGTQRQWYQLHAQPFVAAIEAGVRAIMTAHIRYPAFDVAPATLSRRILSGLLRQELGFDGVVVTDALDMAAISARYGPTAGAVAALAAGADALCLGPVGGEAHYRRVRQAVVDAVRSGLLPYRRLVEAAERVERLHASTGRSTTGAADDQQCYELSFALGVELVRKAAVTNRLPGLRARPVVVELRAAPNLAVGAAGWEIGAPLRRLGYPPEHTVRVAGPGPHLDQALARANGHPLVIVGRDVLRRSRQRDVWRTALAARPDTVLVDLGLPRPDELGDTGYLLVGGAARPNLQVAAELLVTGRGN